MKLRKARVSDLKTVASIWRESLPDEYEPRYARKHLKERQSLGEIFVIEEAGKVAAALTFARDYFADSDYAVFLMVDKKYRRRGFATTLMKAYESQARKRHRRRIFSSVEPGRTASLKLHRKLGYKRCGFIDNLWEDGKRDLFFSKKL
jgi:ribosomal protein S18 acetylase RimI-like enzyme